MSKEAPSGGGEDTGFSQAEGLSELSAVENLDSSAGSKDESAEGNKGGYFDRENFLARKEAEGKAEEGDKEPAPIAGGSGEAATLEKADRFESSQELRELHTEDAKASEKASARLRDAQKEAKGLKGRRLKKAESNIEYLAGRVRSEKRQEAETLKVAEQAAEKFSGQLYEDAKAEMEADLSAPKTAESEEEKTEEPETGPNYEHNPNKAFEMAHAEKANREAGLAASKAGQVERARGMVEKAMKKGEEAGEAYEAKAEELRAEAVVSADKIVEKAEDLYRNGKGFEFRLDIRNAKDADELQTLRTEFFKSAGAGREIFSRKNEFGGFDSVRETTHEKTKVVIVERINDKGQLVASTVIGMDKAMVSRGGRVSRALGTLRGLMRGERYFGSKTKPSAELLEKIKSIGYTSSSGESGGEGPPLRRKRPGEE